MPGSADGPYDRLAGPAAAGVEEPDARWSARGRHNRAGPWCDSASARPRRKPSRLGRATARGNRAARGRRGIRSGVCSGPRAGTRHSRRRDASRPVAEIFSCRADPIGPAGGPRLPPVDRRRCARLGASRRRSSRRGALHPRRRLLPAPGGCGPPDCGIAAVGRATEAQACCATMVRIRGFTFDGVDYADYFMDRYEVTNREYKAFVDGGGYTNRTYWTPSFVKGGSEIAWEQQWPCLRTRPVAQGPVHGVSARILTARPIIRSAESAGTRRQPMLGLPERSFPRHDTGRRP